MAGAPSTPPPTSRIRTPPTPRFGFEDEYQPYALRKSTRVASQRGRSAQTPPPPPSGHNLRSLNSSPPSTVKRVISTSDTFTPPSTIAKKRTIKSGLLGDDLASLPPSFLDSPRRGARSPQGFHSSIGTKNEMLPTPAKTPQKRPAAKSSSINSIARNLFPIRHDTVEQAMPSPRKSRRRHGGFTLDTFGEDEDHPIAIFTDSKDRLPEVDQSSDNPFYVEQDNRGECSKRGSKRRKVAPREATGGEEQGMDVDRKDGLVYVFRGKKIFRKFTDLDESDTHMIGDDIADELDATVPSRLRGPLTRSSMKPRLLFPTAAQLAANNPKDVEAEEADTDIEEGSAMATTTYIEEKMVATPRAPRFAPVSPPTTVARVTRSKKLSSDDDMAGPSFSTMTGPASPFESWQRTKPQGQKRDGDPITRSGGDKRLRG